MRLILPLALFVGGLGLLAAEMPLAEPSHGSGQRSVVDDSDDWRRTVNGWQRSSEWNLAAKHEAPALHPAVVGSLQLLLVLTVALAVDLVATSRKPVGTATNDKSKSSGRNTHALAKHNGPQLPPARKPRLISRSSVTRRRNIFQEFLDLLNFRV